MNKMKAILIISALLIVFFSCRKTPENPSEGNKIELGQSVIDTVGYFNSKIITTITDLGGNTISQHGHCWSLTENPTIDDFKTSKGTISQATSFYSDLTSLTPNTKYYIRPYLTYARGTIYGSQLSITTLQTEKPVVTTKAITGITLYTAISGGTVTSDGGLTVTQRGICWSTEQNFDLATSLSSTSNGTGFGIYTSNMLDLLAGTTYYVKAYATNAAGTSYGQTLSFTTTPITTPTVTTADISNITTTSAESGGNITSDGGSSVTARGVCWSTNQNPTTADSKTTDGTGTGSFISSLVGLIPWTTYYVRAYATNEKGSSYGELNEFETYVTIIDSRDGQVYKTVVIGSQIWFAENLKYLPSVVGYGTGSETTPYYFVYGYDGTVVSDAKATSNYTTYGVLYNWIAAMNSAASSTSNPSGVQGVCPSGWHLPSDDEWKQMEMFIGMNQSTVDNIGWRGTDEGSKLKSTSGWYVNSGNNSSSFTALPGGFFNAGVGYFDGLGKSGFWWSSSESSSSIVVCRTLSYDKDGIFLGFNGKTPGFSVRCLKDD
ncbi:MAG: FISUMP domain-containing protein [Bacteroidales bacterium]|jgi:uncharacterized protein (TIGR02145 family)|nr:FISUMP domain-containing protein [Bacteroidales bacterium]